MTVLSADEARVFGRSLALACRSRFEKVSVQRPAVERVEQYVDHEVRQATMRVISDLGAQPWTFALLALAVLLGAGLWAVVGAVAGLLGFAAGGGGFAFAFRRFRRTSVREEQVEEKVPVTKERSVLVPVPDGVEDRRVPATMRVVSVGRVELDFLAIPAGSGTALVDPEGGFPPARVTLRRPREPVALTAELKAVRSATSEVPSVLSGESASFPLRPATSFGESIRLTGTERQLWEGFDRLEKRIRDLKEETFELSLVPTRHPLRRFLLRQATVPRALPQGTASSRGLLEAVERAQRYDAALAAAAVDLPARHAALAGARLVALREKIGPLCHNLGHLFHYSAFHFYCPDCNAEIQEDLLARDYSLQDGSQWPPVAYSKATLLHYDPNGPCWSCPQCEGRFPLQTAIPVHRMLDEVFLPVYDRLMEEHKTERLRIYSDTRDRELDYRNQFERDMDTLVHGTRTSLELILDEMRRLDAEIAAEHEALVRFKEAMVSHGRVEARGLARVEQSARQIEDHVRETATEKVREGFAVQERGRAAASASLQGLSRARRLDDESRDARLRQIASAAREAAAHGEDHAEAGGASDASREARKQASAIVGAMARTAVRVGGLERCGRTQEMPR